MTLQGAFNAQRTAKVGVACGHFGAVPAHDACALFHIEAFSQTGGAGQFHRRLERPVGILKHASFFA
jgi:hypothetical protein